MKDKVATSGVASNIHAQSHSLTTATPSNQPPVLFLDKISLTFNIPNESHRKYIFQHLIEMPKELESGWLPAQWGAYRVAARLHAPTAASNPVEGPWSKGAVLLQAHPKNGEGGYLRAEWNPSRFDATQKDHIFAAFDNFFDLPPPEIGKAKVTRADLTVDLPNVQVGDYVFERLKSPFRTTIHRKGMLQTIYLGKPGSSQVCVYDKGAHLGNKTLKLTRVEVHSWPNRPAADLHTLKNPFETIRVLDVAKAGLKIGTPHIKTLLRAARAEGLYGLLADFPKLAAAEISSALVASYAPFWKPDEFWKQWPGAIAAAFPAFGQPDHYGSSENEAAAPAFGQSGQSPLP